MTFSGWGYPNPSKMLQKPAIVMEYSTSNRGFRTKSKRKNEIEPMFGQQDTTLLSISRWSWTTPRTSGWVAMQSNEKLCCGSVVGAGCQHSVSENMQTKNKKSIAKGKNILWRSYGHCCYLASAYVFTGLHSSSRTTYRPTVDHHSKFSSVSFVCSLFVRQTNKDRTNQPKASSHYNRQRRSNDG